MPSRNTRPPTPEEIEETNNPNFYDRLITRRNDRRYLREYHIPEWVWEEAEKQQRKN